MERTDLCLAAKTELNLDAYNRKAFQELYALRYIPAYYFEYCALANELDSRLRKKFSNINVVSLGCGLCPDYYALMGNLVRCAFNYTGYDVIEWSRRQFMPPIESNYKFVQSSVTDLNISDITNIDAFVFPKSIGDIRDSKEGAIDKLAATISATQKDRLFFLNSYVTKDMNRPLDLSAFITIHDALLAAGFSTKDDVNKTFYLHDGVTTDKPIGLFKINSGFEYPDKNRVTCDKQDDNAPGCKICPVPKSPIFTNKFMSFHLMEYERS